MVVGRWGGGGGPGDGGGALEKGLAIQPTWFRNSARDTPEIVSDPHCALLGRGVP